MRIYPLMRVQNACNRAIIYAGSLPLKTLLEQQGMANRLDIRRRDPTLSAGGPGPRGDLRFIQLLEARQ